MPRCRRNRRRCSHTRIHTMIRISSSRITTPKTVRIAVLVAAVCTAATPVAADSGGMQSKEPRQSQALQRQLAAVQAQMKQQAQHNQTLLREERELDRAGP